MLLVYIKQMLFRHVSDVEVDQVPTGMHGIMVRREGGKEGRKENLQCAVNTLHA
jgi:hypothetical protein